MMLTIPGIESYIAEGLLADKLVLGLPWYGFVYKCVSLSPVSMVENQNSTILYNTKLYK